MRHKAVEFQRSCHLCQLNTPRAASDGLGQHTWVNVGEQAYLDVGDIKNAGGVASLVLVTTD